MKAFKQVFLSQFRMFIRQRITFTITIIMPLALGIFLGVIFSGKGVQNVRVLFVNEDPTDAVRLMIQGIIEGTKDSQLKIKEADRADALTQLQKDKVDSVLVFPEGTALSIEGVKDTRAAVYFKPNRVQSAIARLVLENLISELNLRAGQAKKVFTLEEHPLGKKGVSLASFFFPNFLAISLLWMSLFATALPLVSQRERGALVQMKTTPLSPITFMLGNILTRLFIGFLQCGLFVAAGLVFMKMTTLDNLIPLVFAVLLANLCLIFMGYMIASISKSTQNADAISQVFNFSMMFLSGVFFTKDMLPDFVNKISYVIPLTYVADLFRQLMTGYEGSFPLWLNFAVLTGFGILFAAIGLRFFRLFSR